MNFFTKSILAGLLPCATVSAQSLYSIAPNDDEAAESLPLTYVAGVNFGFDDNPTPLFGGLNSNDGGATFLSGFVQANWTNVTPQTTWDVFARLGVRFYLDGLEGTNVDDTVYSARAGVNYTHRFSERLRFSSRNFLAYEIEPDFDFSIGSDIRSGQYFRWSTDNSIGYRWTDRLGTQTGVTFSGIVFEDLDDSDFNTITLRHDFRYRFSPQTVITGGYRYRTVNNDAGGDTGSHFLVGGVEHRISPTSAIVLRAGAQITDPDGGGSTGAPFIEAALRSQLTSQLNTNVFARYSSEGFNRSLIDLAGNRFNFEDSQTFRVGARATYALNPRVSLFGGINVILTSYDDQILNPGDVPATGDQETIFHANAGASYQLNDNLFLTSSYNFTNADSDFSGRSFSRNRVQVGIQTTF